ncbi:lipopolysaccharide biosynthesis protein [Thiobacillus sedimenti]|uniref:Polysaccharide biosynthesis protein C-terminal domain-containing protein n=1 Tax=Thiobacillus sedimenti TaxID=3110231 RepID=A0ABZ1CGL8_9PROT|nr:hypothetical protein [Thiobacillus sp. SCUT-2]WRS38329.1 hypothetical protein VA613_09955 [Thiobacillus sp. SCUT-2]
MNTHARYGRERVRKGVVHFLFGKGLSALTGVVILLLLVRELSVPEFAVYSVLLGFVEILSALAGLGLAHTVQRYVPELYAQHANRAFRGLVISTFCVRLAALSLAVGIAHAYAPYLAAFFNAAGWVAIFQIYLGVVWLRATNQFLFQLLESTLHQKMGQGAFVLSSFIRLVMLLWVVSFHALTLKNLILIELATELVCLLLLASGVIRVLGAAAPQPGEESFAAWWSRNAKRLIRFSVMSYLQHLAILPGTSSVSRIVAGGYLAAVSTAAFGLAQSVAEMVRRYMPAQFFAGLLRPVLVARFTESAEFSRVDHVLDIVFRVNFMLIGWLGVVVLAAGEDGLGFVTGGQYGHEAGRLILLMLVVLVMETQRSLLDLALQVVEHYEILIFSNLLLSSSVIMAIALTGYIGAYAIPLASLTGLVVSNLLIKWYLRKLGYSYSSNIVGRAALVFIVGGGVAFALAQVLVWWLSGLIAALIYPVLGYLLGVFHRDEIAQFRQLLAKPRGQVTVAA